VTTVLKGLGQVRTYIDSVWEKIGEEKPAESRKKPILIQENAENGEVVPEPRKKGERDLGRRTSAPGHGQRGS